MERYIPAGTYIGQIIKPQNTPIEGVYRIPVFIGKGSRLAKTNSPIIRGMVYDEELFFTSSAPFRAVLRYQSNGNLSSAELMQNGIVLRQDLWAFVDDGRQVEIRQDVFDPTATYTISYQSAEIETPDQIPFEDLRRIVAVGNSAGSPDFFEHQNFYLKYTISKTQENVTTTTSEYLIIQDSANTGNGTVGVTPTSNIDTNYNHSWRVEVINKTGADPYNIDVRVSLVYHSGGDPSQMEDEYLDRVWTEFTVSGLPAAGSASSSVTQTVWTGLDLEFTSGGGQEFQVGDIFFLSALGKEFLEIEPTYFNTSDIPEVGNPTGWSSNTGTASLSVLPVSLYDHPYNAKYFVVVENVSATDVTLEVIRISSVGIEIHTVTVDNSDTTFSVDGIIFDLNSPLNAAVGDRWVVEATAPRKWPALKDNRIISLSITNVNQSVGDGAVEVSWLANTPEGGWGTQTVNWQDNQGKYSVPGGLDLWFRNLVVPPFDSIVMASNRFNSGSNWEIQIEHENFIRWDIKVIKEQNYTTGQVYMDLMGSVTGTPGTNYFVLPDVPIEGSTVLVYDSNNTVYPISFNPGTPYAFFTGPVPTTDFVARLISWASQPKLGWTYWFTAHYLRPDDLFNTPLKITNLQEGRQLLGPMESGNDLYVINEIAWRQSPKPVSIYVIQVKDQDEDGTITDEDFRQAIQVAERLGEGTDLVVLRRPSVIPDLLRTINYRMEPTVGLECLGWFGVDNSYSLDDLISLAKTTLAVYGDAPYHGTRILVAPRWAKVSIQDDLGTEVTIDVDGSFVAGALASMVSGFTDPGLDLLRRSLYGFEDLETFGAKDSLDNLSLGAVGIIWFLENGPGSWLIYEDTTVDKFARDFMQINNMTQKQFVVRQIRDAVDKNLIGLVVDSPEDAKALIRGFIKAQLQGFVASGFIAPYRDESGNTRPIRESDIVVYPAPDSDTDYIFKFTFYLRNVIKRLFGYYTVNGQNF